MEQNHLSYSDSINLGSFYTPYPIVSVAYKMLQNVVSNFDNYVILDSSCGSGNFFHERIKCLKKIGIDIDSEAIDIARDKYSDVEFRKKNALSEVSRHQYGIDDEEKLIIVGNPPYNDKTSQIRQNIKQKETKELDEGLECRDIGISFLRSYARLNTDYVCVLHPLSYLIKKANFNSLREFAENYILIDSLVIDSKVFCPRSSFSFPILIGLYKKECGGMTFEDVEKFDFKIENGRTFSLSEYDFIGRYIDKYPNKKRIEKESRVAMFYTMRDINALKRSRTFIDEDIDNSVYITESKYSLYCYVDVFKSYAEKLPFYFGNLDIIIDYKEFVKIERDFIRASRTKSKFESVEKYFRKLFGEHYEN